jgi:hypothetical protein
MHYVKALYVINMMKQATIQQRKGRLGLQHVKIGLDKISLIFHYDSQCKQRLFP